MNHNGVVFPKKKPGVSWISPLILLLFLSCSTPQPEHSLYSYADNAPESESPGPAAEISSGNLPEQMPAEGDQTAGPEKNTPIDPLTEVSDLWYRGLKTRAEIRFHQDDVTALSTGKRHSEWALWRGRLFLRRWSAVNLGLAEDNISALLLDRDDVWAGTWTGGVVRLSEPLMKSVTWDPGIPSLAVRTVNRIARYDGAVWIVRYGAVERFDLRTESWSVESGLPAKERLQDLVIQDSRMYLATLGHGLWVKENRTWQRISEPGLFITRLEKGDNGEILVATMDRGLFVYQPGGRQWKQPPPGALRNVNVTSMLRSGPLIVGGTYGNGAFLWNTEDSGVRFFDEEVLGDPWVMAVASSGERFHFATFGAGVRTWHPVRDEWDSVGIEEGFPSADVVSLAGDSAGTVWAGTLGGGIIRISGDIYGD